jgi:uncharacterized protein
VALEFSNGGFTNLRRLALLLPITLLLAVAVPFFAGTSQQTAKPAQVLNVTKDVAVPMRDGVVLRADVVLPSVTGRFPTLIYRTPYSKQFALKEGSTFEKAVARGYVVVIQDVRGRYASDGDFSPYQNEGRDGFDTIEWAARQCWHLWTFLSRRRTVARRR